MENEAYPLQWPEGWERTEHWDRKRARFGTRGRSNYGMTELTIAHGLARLIGELQALRVWDERCVISTDMLLRQDGMPFSNRRPPDDPGAAVYFRLDGKPHSLACDKWDRLADNLAAIAAHIGALRGQDRWGVGSLKQAFMGYVALPAPFDWKNVLGFGIGRIISADDIGVAYRERARHVHPDAGGDHERMAELNLARDAGMAAVEQR